MAGRQENYLDNIFLAMGEFKTFTICQILVMALFKFSSAYQVLSNVFTGQDVPHRCASAPNDSSFHLSGLNSYDPGDLNVSYQQCHIVVSYNNTILKRKDCLYGMAYDRPKDASIVSQFDLVCDYSSLAKLSQTLIIAGQGIGAVFFTILSDRYGRKPILAFSTAGMGVCGVIIALAPNYTVLALFKFLVGTFQQGCSMTFSTLFIEILTTRDRRIQACVSGLLWGLACTTLAPLAYAFQDSSWRMLQLSMSLTSIPFVLKLWFGKESLRWLIANGKSKEVVSYIRTATRINKTSFEETMRAYHEACHLGREERGITDHMDTQEENVTATERLSLIDLLRVKRLLLNAVIMWTAWFTVALSFFVIYFMSTSLAGNQYLNFFLTALMEIPTNFLLYFILNRIGRKLSLIAAFFLIGTGIVVCGICRSLEQNSVNSTFALVTSLIAMGGASAAFSLVYFYTTEIFPTNMRNQALGVSSMMGRVGGMLAPFTGNLGDAVPWGPGALIGSCAFLVCLLTILLPETTGRELPQTIDDVKVWFSKADTNLSDKRKTCPDEPKDAKTAPML